jgi:hypothetical protein
VLVACILGSVIVFVDVVVNIALLRSKDLGGLALQQWVAMRTSPDARLVDLVGGSPATSRRDACS